MEISKRYNSAPLKDNCALFALTPYFQDRAIPWCHLIFFPADLCCHGNKSFLFKDKIGCSTACIKMSQTLLHHTLFFSLHQLSGGILKTVNKFIIIKSNNNNFDKSRLKTAKIRAKKPLTVYKPM